MKRILLLIAILIPLLTSCKKENWKSPYYLRCTINGVGYEEWQPLLGFNTPPSPRISYYERDNCITYWFSSTPEKKTNASTLFDECSLHFSIVSPVTDPIIIGETYRFTAPILEEDVYTSNSCGIAHHYGEGYVKFSTFDLEKGWAEGVLVFDIPFFKDSDPDEIFPLHIEGNFKCAMKDGVLNYKK